MDALQGIDHGLEQLRRAVSSLEAGETEGPTNCDPWTVRRLASHALNNQMFWAGLVADAPSVSFDDVMGAVPLEGDLAPVADEVAATAAALWRTEGVLDAVHATPLGEVPGSVVSYFAIIDAMAHAWDLTASVGRPIEFPPDELEWLAEVVAATCTDEARAHGLIQAPTPLPDDATETERLMSAAGRVIRREA